jgi:hypothetical protein
MFKRAILRPLLVLHWAPRNLGVLQGPSPLALLCSHEKTLLALIADCAGVVRGRQLRSARDAFEITLPICKESKQDRAGGQASGREPSLSSIRH